MTDERLVAIYPRRLRRAARRLPRPQWRDLIDHISEYIAGHARRLQREVRRSLGEPIATVGPAVATVGQLW
ncbi:MAG: hypothetical protein J2P28_13415 [Actinobacteria bacterium]|nr:hypothetical protein [Actinomycetota bacterium]MBO0836489.1 hypothetical protein [Actinomycetota bacterium]